jgi:hypothetical protein
VRVTLRYFDGCPGWKAVAERLDDLARQWHITVAHERVATPEAAERLAFRGSPTVLIDGLDPFATGDEPTGLSCRVYATPHGLDSAPTHQQLRAALEAAGARPRPPGP